MVPAVLTLTRFLASRTAPAFKQGSVKWFEITVEFCGEWQKRVCVYIGVCMYVCLCFMGRAVSAACGQLCLRVGGRCFWTCSLRGCPTPLRRTTRMLCRDGSYTAPGSWSASMLAWPRRSAQRQTRSSGRPPPPSRRKGAGLTAATLCVHEPELTLNHALYLMLTPSRSPSAKDTRSIARTPPPPCSHYILYNIIYIYIYIL